MLNLAEGFSRTGLEDGLLFLVLKLSFVIIIKLRTRILDQNGIHHSDGRDIGQNLIVAKTFVVSTTNPLFR